MIIVTITIEDIIIREITLSKKIVTVAARPATVPVGARE